MNRRVAIIGGGASGMIAAIGAARGGAIVTVFEKNDRVGKKILATGNGKCNFSNRNMKSAYYYGSAADLCDSLYTCFGVEETVRFFEELGMRVKDKNGYLYPATEQAATVLDLLRYEMETQHVEVRTDCTVEEISHNANKFYVKANKKQTEFDAVIITCGGMASPKTGSDGSGYRLAKALGHSCVKTVPALTALRCKGEFFKAVAGVRCNAKITLTVQGKEKVSERGELQLTDYGISGIPVFQISREAGYALKEKKQVTAEIDFLPEYDSESYQEFWKNRFGKQKEYNLERCLTGVVNKKIVIAICKVCGLKLSDSVKTLNTEQRNRLQNSFKHFEVEVTATNGFDNAQVCAGGIPAKELTDRLESKVVNNLFFAGEIIDIDGICGGYNLQWAWTSGYITGCLAANPNHKHFSTNGNAKR